jgi:hypothetical protein
MCIIECCRVYNNWFFPILVLYINEYYPHIYTVFKHTSTYQLIWFSQVTSANLSRILYFNLHHLKKIKKAFKVEKDTMGKKKLVNEFFWISFILFFEMYLTKYQNLRLGFQAYLKNIPWKSYLPLKSNKISFFSFLHVIKVPKKK